MVDTIQRYAAALGGELTLAANLGNQRLPLTDHVEEVEEIHA